MLRWLIACLLIASAQSALADNLGDPMTFKMYTYDAFFGPHVEIEADGVILLDTPDQFRAFLAGKDIPPGSDVYLTSEGGNVYGGLKLGRLIREHKFNTVVGAHHRISDRTINALHQGGVGLLALFSNMPFRAPTPPSQVSDTDRWASYCISSCTFAMLGGVERFVGFSSIYAVHQFHFNCDDPQLAHEALCTDPSVSSSSSQALSADLAVYLQEMGISQEFLKDMVLAEPNKVNVLIGPDLVKYHICTNLFECAKVR